MKRTTTMGRINSVAAFVVLVSMLAVSLHSQKIESTYADLTLPGNWQAVKQYAAAQSGSDIYFDPGTATLLLISQQGGMQKVSEIAKFFGSAKVLSKEASGVMSSAEFPLPMAYTERASRDLGKGTKPPRMWEMKEGEGNPVWFYSSQLFDEYRMRNTGGSSEVSEEFMSVRVVIAEQRSVTGGDALLFEIETEKPAGDAALKRYRMSAGLKDQLLRYGWVQFAPGGIAAGQGVLSVAFATSANSKLTIEEVVKQVSAAKIKPL